MKINLTSLIMVVLFQTVANAAIFGFDNRKNPDRSEPQQKVVRATAIAVLSSNREVQNNRLAIDTSPLSDFVCKDERFSSEPSLSYACTGFLVAPDLLVTAGHCLSNHEEVKNQTAGYCEVFDWLFDYKVESDGTVQTSDIPLDRLYKCKEIVYAIEEDTAPFRDFALVRLNRPAADREPLKMSNREIKVGDPVSMVGYPLGLPAKVTDGARAILNNTKAQAFVTNLDAFEGNSGSPVLNSFGEVVGILVGGTPSEGFIKDQKKMCNRYNRCDENGLNCLAEGFSSDLLPNFQTTGSDVQRIAPVIEIIQKSK